MLNERKKQSKRLRQKQDRKEKDLNLGQRLITNQIVLIHTLDTPFFEHFLCSNQPN